uniref:Kinesin motor domain-containing protein n=1 Tax=Otus sunia TaxID=257818 RepID=A0A8C8BCF9_9STRI
MARVQVALRIRPMSAAELAEGAWPVAHRLDEQVVVLRDPLADPDDVLRASRSRQKSYSFDVAFDATATQETVYRATTQSLVTVVISGSNATVFAYGPTGCGKTYTMLGTDGEPGLCARTLGELFQAIEEASGDVEYEVSMSYLEIYNEMIRDLLDPSLGCLQLREDAGGTVQVTGITQIPATSAHEVSQRALMGQRGGGGCPASPPQRFPSAPGHAAAGAGEPSADAGAHGRQPHLVAVPRGAAGHRAPAAAGRGAAPRPPLHDRPGGLRAGGADAEPRAEDEGGSPHQPLAAGPGQLHQGSQPPGKQQVHQLP